MNLRTKTMLILAGVILFTIILLATWGRIFWLSRYADLEEYYVRLNVDRVESALTKDTEDLVNSLRDWSAWDDTYQYVIDANQDYYVSNIVTSSFIENQYDFMVIADRQGSLITAEQYDNENNLLRPVTSSIKAVIQSGKYEINDVSDHYEGMLLLPEGIALVAIQPIIDSNYNGPVHGTMMVGRYIDSAYIDGVSELTHTDVKLVPLTAPPATALPPALLDNLDTYSRTTFIQPDNDLVTSGYLIINDVNQKPVLAMQASIPRRVYHHGVQSFWYFMGFWTLCALAFYVLINKLLSGAVLNRIEQLDGEVTNIGSDEDLKERVTVAGNDEVTSLARAINSMLDTIEHSHWQVRGQEREYRRLFDNSITANIVCDQEGKIVLCNQTFISTFNFSNMVMASSVPVSKLFRSPEDYQQCLVNLKHLGYELNLELEMQTYDGLPIVVVGNLFADLDAIGEIQRVTAYLFNITERKGAEEQLRYLGQHDSNTGLYNRAYFEYCLSMIESNGVYPVSIVVGDIDGLKLVNDTLGFDAGDRLLRETAAIISACADDNSVCARTGGDEFAIILYLERARDAIKVVDSIRQMANVYNMNNPELPLSLSLGSSRVGTGQVPISELFREANNYMNREKLHRTRSGRSSLVAALTSTLEARDYITEGHAERLQILVEKLARMMNMADYRITDLKLFAQFHDIGKVGIPDQVLNKPDELTAEEWEEMQRHSEIGYRIAQAAPELHHISEWILKHHEWWNGNGYPLGIAGFDIPIESRMLAIVDAYDAMTSDRPYRRAMAPEKALMIIAEQSGKQFDPNLVAAFLEIMKDGPAEAAATGE